MIVASRGWSTSILLAATTLLLGLASVTPDQPAAVAIAPQRDRHREETSHRLIGTVLDDSTGRPLSAATVGTSLELSHFVRTDANGRFRLALPDERAVNVYAYAPGMATTHRAGVRSGQGDLTLRLVAGARLTARILAGSWRAPLLVSVCRPTTGRDVSTDLCVARLLVREGDATPPGSFSLEALPAGRFALRVERGESLLAERAITLRAGSTTALGELMVR